MKKIAVLPCGKKKIWDVNPSAGPVYAKQAYQGTLHKKCARYARFHNLYPVILSAKYGFLHPEDIVPDNYDTGFQHHSGVISDTALTSQWHMKGFSETDTIVVLTGKKHQRVLNRVIDTTHQWEFPLSRARGIGEMLQILDQSVQR